MTQPDSALPSSDIKRELERAFALLNGNELPAAEQILADILLRSEDADALQLLGLIRSMQGRAPEAEELYRRSLAANPDQPHVHNNLGKLLCAVARYDESVAELREAIRLKPNYAEAHLSLALTFAEKRDHAAAEKSCRNALRLQPNYLLARQTLGAELNELDRPKEAEAVLRQALALNPRDPRQVAALEHNLAVSLKMQKRHADALLLFESARAKVPGMPLLDYNTANTLQEVGRLEEAVELYRRAVARDPLNIQAHRELNTLLYRLGDDENFLKSYDEVAAFYPDAGFASLDKGNYLYLKGKYDEAGEAFERAARLLPYNVMPHDGLGLILAEKGEFEAAIGEHEIAVAMEPENAHAWRNFSQTLLRAGDAKAARTAAERALAIEANNQGALAVWGLALRILGDAREEEFNDVDNLVRAYEIEPPAGYGDVGSFNRDLNSYLDRIHKDRREHIDQTLRSGTQTPDKLFGAGHAPVEQLRASIDKAVADYIARLKQDETHPLLKRRRAQFGYTDSWSSRLRDGGFHTNHVHPRGWISSAYYVALPEAVNDAERQEGWLKFGEPNFDCGIKNVVRRTVQPRVGTLVLFPSYMWHGTIPFRSNQSRTTIAFDVVPRENA